MTAHRKAGAALALNRQLACRGELCRIGHADLAPRGIDGRDTLGSALEQPACGHFAQCGRRLETPLAEAAGARGPDIDGGRGGCRPNATPASTARIPRN
jgi:hypothetical protein